MEPETEKEKNKRLQQLGVFMGIPMTLLACLFVGWAIGSFLDNRFHTGGVLLAVFVLLGMAAGFYEVFRLLKNFS